MAARTTQEAPALTLWCVTSGADEGRCVVVFTPCGFEAQFRLNGALLYSHMLDRLDEVTEWAEVRRSEMLEHGWRPAADDDAVAAMPRSSQRIWPSGVSALTH